MAIGLANTLERLRGANMYIHIGKRMYGKCDVVPELFYVATTFFHFDFFPLVPLESRLVFGGDGKISVVNGKVIRGMKIPLSVKSIFYAWARVGAFITSVSLTVMAVSEACDGGGMGGQQNGEGGGLAVLAGASILAYTFLMIYPRRMKPSYRRASQLAALAKLDERGWAALNVLYGREIDERP